MIFRKVVQLGLAFTLLTIGLEAQSAGFFPLEEVRPGLKATGRTVFEGTQVEGFDVEILGVLEKTGPQQNLILARLSGEKVDRYGVFAGMSGSPVYVDGRLLGAVAYAFSFATEPIAGITPIREMVEIFQEHGGASFELANRRNPEQIYEVAGNPAMTAEPSVSRSLDVVSQFPSLREFGKLRPIGTPLNLGGFSTLSLDPFSEKLKSLGMTPVIGAASGKDNWEDAPLEPGSTVAVQLLRGDMEVAASGTVTHISGNKVYAFGHPFLSTGYTDLPLTKAAVLGVIPNLMNSQKISASTEAIGAIKQDRATGILGVEGVEAELIPVRLTLETSRGEEREFNYEVVSDTFLTPFLMAFTVHSSIISSERSVGGQTLQLKCEISVEGQPEVSFENVITDMASSPALAAIMAASPVDFIMTSGFDDVVLQKIDIEIRAVEETKEAVLDKVWLDKVDVRAGEELDITVFLRKSNGDLAAETYPVKIPEGITPGPLKILVGDGMTITRNDAQTSDAEFIPRDLGQLVRAINNLKKNDRLYIRLFREEKGAVIAGQGMPGLPPSLLALYSSQKTTGDIQPINRVVFIEHELPATDHAISGHKIIEVNVKG